MGFIILVVRFVIFDGWHTNNMVGGICSVIGKWSKFKFSSMMVEDVYSVGFSVLIRKSTIRLVLV